ncbi:type II toxin-antitoxin system RelE/ParE family toxin [Methylomonas sp. MgM2]
MSIPVRLEPVGLLAFNDFYLLEVSDKVAAKIIDTLETAVNSLADLNERGSVPKKSLAWRIRQYSQLIAKSYRLRLPDQIVAHTIPDGRCDIQTLLIQRLIGNL